MNIHSEKLRRDFSWVRIIPISFSLLIGISCSDIRTANHASLVEFGVPCCINQKQGVDLEIHAPNRFTVSIPCVVKCAEKQPKGTQWCWAACAAIVLRTKGLNVSIDELTKLVIKLSSDPRVDINTQIGSTALEFLLNPDLAAIYIHDMERDGLPSKSTEDYSGHPELKEDGADILVQELSLGEPVVIGLCDKETNSMHLCVAYAATYSVAKISPIESVGSFLISRGTRDHYAIHSIRIIDPDPDVPMELTLQSTELEQQAHYFTSARLARAHSIRIINELREIKRRTGY